MALFRRRRYAEEPVVDRRPVVVEERRPGIIGSILGGIASFIGWVVLLVILAIVLLIILL